MTAQPTPPGNDRVKAGVKIVMAQWGPIGLSLTALSTALSFGVLFIYLDMIGYSKLLVPALGTKTALIPWIIIAAGTLAVYLGGLLIASGFYASTLRLFNREPSVQPYMALMLMLPALTGITALIVVILIGQRTGPVTATLVSALIVFVTIALMCSLPRFRHAIQLAAKPAVDDLTTDTWLKRATRIGGVAGGIWGAALSAVFPMLLLISTYVWPDNRINLYKLVFGSVAIATLGLIPAAAFYLSKDGLWLRARNAMVGILLLFAAVQFFAPATVPAAVDSAAKVMGVQDRHVYSYMIKDTYGAEDFDARWGDVRTVRGFPVVEAFTLFSLGDLLLLCPQTLATTKRQDWPSVSRACLLVDGKTTRPMPEKKTADK